MRGGVPYLSFYWRSFLVEAYMNTSFKPEMNLVKLIEKFSTDDNCRKRLAELRWPDGVACPRCQCKSISCIEDREQYDCNACRYQFSVTSGTIFHDSHLPLIKWFLATYL